MFAPNPASVVIAGDICNGVPEEQERDWLRALSDARAWSKGILMVLGNHDHYGADLMEAPSLWKAALKGTRIQVLDRAVATVDGVRFAGCMLWTDFDRGSPLLMLDAHALNDYRHIKEGGKLARSDDVLDAHDRDLNWLLDQPNSSADSPLGVITHHAPSWESTHPGKRNDPITGAIQPLGASLRSSSAYRLRAQAGMRSLT